MTLNEVYEFFMANAGVSWGWGMLRQPWMIMVMFLIFVVGFAQGVKAKAGKLGVCSDGALHHCSRDSNPDLPVAIAGYKELPDTIQPAVKESLEEKYTIEGAEILIKGKPVAKEKNPQRAIQREWKWLKTAVSDPEKNSEILITLDDGETEVFRVVVRDGEAYLEPAPENETPVEVQEELMQQISE